MLVFLFILLSFASSPGLRQQDSLNYVSVALLPPLALLGQILFFSTRHIRARLAPFLRVSCGHLRLIPVTRALKSP